MPKAKDAKSKKETRSIKIRMYRVGFGDCFLLSLPVGKGQADEYRHFVIDCGVHGKGNIGMIEKAVDNIGEITGGKIAAIIATHSHQDHISGFSEKFSQFEIGEVWLPWSEDPKDKLANKWSKKQEALAAQLEMHFAAQAKARAADAKTVSRRSALAAVMNLTSNKKAIGLLKSGFNVGATVKYFSAGAMLNDAAGVPGLTVQVLGPPRDEKFLAKMDPPKDQRYLKLNAADEIVGANELAPFPQSWIMKYDSGSAPLSPPEEKYLKRQLSDTSLDGLAFALDSAKNNTSLVTLFIFNGKHLLFPGDAQYGNWQSWIEKDDAGDILSKINFLKVSHHASHNGTPKGALEKMTTGEFAAMVSTQSVPWDSIPRVPLMQALSKQTSKRVVRSDWIDIAGLTKAPSPLPGSIPKKPATLPAGFSLGDFWYDYEL